MNKLTLNKPATMCMVKLKQICEMNEIIKGPYTRCCCGCDFFAATNGLHWIQCECSHWVTVAVAVVLHKMGSNGLFGVWFRTHFSAAVASALWDVVQVVVYQKSLIFSNFWTFENKNSDLFNVCFNVWMKKV